MASQKIDDYIQSLPDIPAKRSRAQHQMREALLELYRKKPMAEITVQELCKKAGVARSTFYRRYNNITELLEEMEDDLVTILRANSVQFTRIEIFSGQSLDFLYKFLDDILKDRDVFLVFLVEHPNSRFIQKWRYAIEDFFRRRIRHFGKSLDHEEFNLSLLSSMLVESVAFYLEHPDKVDQDYILDYSFRYLEFLGLVDGNAT